MSVSEDGEKIVGELRQIGGLTQSLLGRVEALERRAGRPEPETLVGVELDVLARLAERQAGPEDRERGVPGVITLEICRLSGAQARSAPGAWLVDMPNHGVGSF